MFLKNAPDIIERLKSERNIAHVLVNDVVREARGLIVSPLVRKPFGKTNILEVLKPVIGLVAEVDGSVEAGKTFGVGPDTASGYRDANRDKIEKELEPVRTMAIERLASAISRIDDEKLQDVGALNLSNIARNLSTVVMNTRKKDAEEGGSKFQFNIFAPSVSKINEYEIMDVK